MAKIAADCWDVDPQFSKNPIQVEVPTDFTRTIDGAATEFYQAFEALPVPQNQRAGQLRVLRTIHSVVIREMINRLQPRSNLRDMLTAQPPSTG